MMTASAFNNTLKTLSEINLDLSHHAKQADLLAVRTTKDKKKELVLIKRADLGFFGRIWTWLGFGSASLKKVSQFLTSQEGIEQLKQIETIKKVDPVLQKIFSNLQKLNDKKLTSQAAGCHLLRAWTARAQLLPLQLIENLQMPSLLQEAEKKIAELNQEKDRLKTIQEGQYRSACQEIVRLNGVNQETQKQLTQQKEEFQARLLGKIEEIEALISEKTALLQQLNLKKALLEKKESELQKQEVEVQELKNIRKAFRQTEDKRKELELEVAQLKTLIAEGKLNSTPQVDLEKRFEQKVAELNKIVQTQENALKEKTQFCTDKQAEIATLQKRLAEANQSYKEALEKCKQMGQDNQEAAILCHNAEVELEGLRNELNKQYLELQFADTQLQILKKQNGEAQEDKKALQEVVRQKDQILSDLNAQLLTLQNEKKQQECIECKQKMAQIAKEKDEAIAALQQLHQSLKEKELAFAKEKEGLIKDKGELNQKLGEVQGRLGELSRQQKETQANMDRQLGEYISRQLKLPPEIDLDKTVKLIQTTVQNVVQGIENKDLPQLLDQITKQTREQMNAVAIKELFVEMEKDQSIDEEVKKTFQLQWHLPSGGVIGSDVKNNTAFLTKERRQQILEKAREISKERQNLNEAIGQFQNKINEDIKLGRFVPASTKQVRERYKSYFDLIEKSKGTLSPNEKKDVEAGLQREFTLICNAAAVHQEIKRKTQHARTGTLAETVVLEVLGYKDLEKEDVQAKLKQAEINVLQLLLVGNGIEEEAIETIKEKMAFNAQRARLFACLNPEDQPKLDNIQFLINKIKTDYTAICRECNQRNASQIEGLGDHFPEKAKKHLLDWKRKIVNRNNTKALKQALKDHKGAIQRLLNTDSKKISEAIDLLLSEVEGRLFSGEVYKADSKAELQPSIDFYNNWQDYLDAEMIQGLDDEQEVFTKGVCFALSTELAVKEQRQEFDPVKQGGKGTDIKSGVGSILATHRYRQASHSMNVHLQKAGASATEVLFPAAMCKKLGVKKGEVLLHKQNPNIAQGDFEAFLKSPLQKQKLEEAKGVVLTSIYMKSGGGHAIYVRYDVKNQIYRMFDPNVGHFSFKNESQLFTCFKDLNKVFYGDLKGIVGCRFVL